MFVHVDGGTGLDTVLVNTDGSGTAAVQFDLSQDLSLLNLGNGGSARLDSGAGNVIYTRNLTVAVNGRLDLTDGDMIVDYPVLGGSPIGTWTGAKYDGVTGLIASGRNGGFWNGNGIATSELDAQSELTTLGVAEASDVLGLAGSDTALWGGFTVNATCVLVKYTYTGDANLDGVIDPDDHALFDFNDVNPNAHNYFNGDFNFDGDINADDAALMVFNFIAQGAPL
jgi:hypothetical protein